VIFCLQFYDDCDSKWRCIFAYLAIALAALIFLLQILLVCCTLPDVFSSHLVLSSLAFLIVSHTFTRVSIPTFSVLLTPLLFSSCSSPPLSSGR
jgi:hypothetical protein